MKDDFAELTGPVENEAAAPEPAAPEKIPEAPAAPPPAPQKKPAPSRAAKLFRGSRRSNPVKPVWNIIRGVFRKDSVPNLVLVLTLIAVTVAGMLAVVYAMTDDVIAGNRQKAADEALAHVFPGKTLEFEPLAENPGVYAAREEGGALAGYAVPAAPGGYAGPVEMLVGVDMGGRVTGVWILRQRESRGFDRDNSFPRRNGGSYLDAFIGKTGPFTVGKNVDAVAGATVSSEAVARGVSEAAELARAQLRNDTEGEGDAG